MCPERLFGDDSGIAPTAVGFLGSKKVPRVAPHRPVSRMVGENSHHFTMRSTILSAIAIVFFFSTLSGDALAQNTVSESSRFAYGANIGWIDLKPASPDPTVGLKISTQYLSGYVYSGNIGWISLGDGSPANGSVYSNASADDYGVNLGPDGTLLGYAYGANIGWINFSVAYPAGTAPEDFPKLVGAELSGFAYSANAGWIELGAKFTTATDTDGDGMPDAWEQNHLQNNGLDPAQFPVLITADTDNDGDGFSDLGEYLAGTDPFDPTSLLQMLSLSIDDANDEATVTWTSRSIITYTLEISTDLWLWTTVADDIHGDLGSETSHTFAVDLANTPRLFARVIPRRQQVGGGLP